MSEIRWQYDIPAARLNAKTAQRPLLVDFYSETCLGCEKMAAFTYQQPPVIDAIQQGFVPVKLNVKELTSESRELIRMVKPLFTPLLLFLDHAGPEIRRFTGYLPPMDFLAELDFVLAWTDQLHGRYRQALERFRGVGEQYPRSHVAPEALYWAGVAAYRVDGQGLDGLIPEWAELRTRYPESTWWARASCIAERIEAAGVS